MGDFKSSVPFSLFCRVSPYRTAPKQTSAARSQSDTVISSGSSSASFSPACCVCVWGGLFKWKTVRKPSGNSLPLPPTPKKEEKLNSGRAPGGSPGRKGTPGVWTLNSETHWPEGVRNARSVWPRRAALRSKRLGANPSCYPPPLSPLHGPVRREAGNRRGSVAAQGAAQRRNCNLTNPCISLLIYYKLHTDARCHKIKKKHLLGCGEEGEREREGARQRVKLAGRHEANGRGARSESAPEKRLQKTGFLDPSVQLPSAQLFRLLVGNIPIPTRRQLT